MVGVGNRGKMEDGRWKTGLEQTGTSARLFILLTCTTCTSGLLGSVGRCKLQASQQLFTAWMLSATNFAPLQCIFTANKRRPFSLHQPHPPARSEQLQDTVLNCMGVATIAVQVQLKLSQPCLYEEVILSPALCLHCCLSQVFPRILASLQLQMQTKATRFPLE